jgi:hypothetical protein
MKTKAQEIKDVLKDKKIAIVSEVMNYNTGEVTHHEVIKVLKGGFLMDKNGWIFKPYYPDVTDIQ